MLLLSLHGVKMLWSWPGKEDKWTEFLTEATSADYPHLLVTVMKWFEVE